MSAAPVCRDADLIDWLLRFTEWFPLRVVSKYPQCIIYFCHNTRVWQTDGQNSDGNTVCCITCSRMVKMRRACSLCSTRLWKPYLTFMCFTCIELFEARVHYLMTRSRLLSGPVRWRSSVSSLTGRHIQRIASALQDFLETTTCILRQLYNVRNLHFKIWRNISAKICKAIILYFTCYINYYIDK